ncbi:MAG TPA: tetratricopeptide repeat protein, partial [Chitinophagaceae bacterium]|nr:tetratricopeptide repeat protein [Chitinophagaceae bacterium]
MRLYSFVYKSFFSVIFIIGFFAASGQDAKYYCSKGDEFYRNRNYDQAIIQYTMAINVDPNYVYAYQWRASAYTAKNEPDLAIADCNTCISLQPGNKFAWANRGYAYARKNQFDLAIEDYSEAIRLDPQYAWAYANRGFAYGQLNYPEHAIRDLSMSLLYDPNNAITYSNRYHAYFKVNEPDSALMDITKAISLSPATAGYYNNRGYFYNTYGAYELSVQDYQTCLSKDPNYSVAYINIISPLVRLHRMQEAKSYYDQYRQKRFTTYLETPKYKFYNHFITAVAQVISGKLEEAWNSLDMASREYGTEIKEETKRSYVDILFLYGYILEQLGEVTEATSLYEQSLVIDANQPDLEEAMERLQQKQADAVTSDKTPPVISLKNPAPSSSIDIMAGNNKTTIVGSAKDISGIAEIKINDILIDKVEEDGLFIANIPLKAGVNSLVISATDKQGNTSSQTFTVNG